MITNGTSRRQSIHGERMSELIRELVTILVIGFGGAAAFACFWVALEILKRDDHP